jgi:integrase
MRARCGIGRRGFGCAIAPPSPCRYRRRSEVGAAVLENLVRVDVQTYLYRLTHSKTDQAGTEHNPDADKPLVGGAAEALSAWLEASGVKSGAIFRRVRGSKAAEPLSAQGVWHIVKRRAQLAGLEGDYGAHSLRSGFVTEAGRQNVPMREAMGMTGHELNKSATMGATAIAALSGCHSRGDRLGR